MESLEMGFRGWSRDGDEEARDEVHRDGKPRDGVQGDGESRDGVQGNGEPRDGVHKDREIGVGDAGG